MSFMAGQALAWLKISMLAVAIGAVLWGMAKMSVALTKRTDSPVRSAHTG